jgi:hypothetical protein
MRMGEDPTPAAETPMNAIKYAATRGWPISTATSRTAEAKTRRQTATQDSRMANGTRAGEPISPISLTVWRTWL